MHFFELIGNLKEYCSSEEATKGINEGLLDKFNKITCYVDEELENEEFEKVKNTIEELENLQTLSNKKEAKVVYLSLLQINKDLMLNISTENLLLLIPKIKQLDIDSINIILNEQNIKSK